MTSEGLNISPKSASGEYQEGETSFRTTALMTLLQGYWFVNLRWVFVISAFVVLVGERSAWPAQAEQRPEALMATVLYLAFGNVGWILASRFLMGWPIGGRSLKRTSTVASQIFANAQISFDLLFLTIIVRYSGGAETPMTMFYLFHMAIGALILPNWQAALQGIWAVLLYAGVGLGELKGVFTPHYDFLPAVGSPGLFSQHEYVLIVSAVFAAGVFGTLFFTMGIGARLDKREQMLREAHRDLGKSQRAIKDLQERRSRFMMTAAHQLKTPLASIQTMTSLISEGIVEGEGVGETCEKIIRRCREGTAQVKELLTLAKLQEADPQRKATEATEVSSVVGEIVAKSKPLADEKNIKLTYHVAEHPGLRVFVHRDDLTDCVANLVENAIKYTPEGGAVTVRVGRRDYDPRSKRKRGRLMVRGIGDSFVYIVVRDTGMGIESEVLANKEDPDKVGSIFDAFRRGAGALKANIPGTGLGLSIVREIVEQAGGRIRAHSRVGEGTTFTVMLPTDQATKPRVRDTRSTELTVGKTH